MANRHQRGQTLVEVLTTIVFIAISAIAIVRFQAYLSYNDNLTNERSVATLLAIDELEKLRDYHVIKTTTGYTSYQSIATGSLTKTYQSTTFTISWTVTEYTYPSYKTMTVTVSWTDRRGSAQSLQLSYNIASIDPAYSGEIL